eukprot:TRINITY_DN14883_c0_g1_i1.p1 TRINITY_DN14883_c0_g1~~TRINITY_DN14883_c0_g1_i1.p1  ORF type:complete len:294 (-),score=50.66 TRINITY_DN14883_c0_g1_i1:83-964(-)
MDNSIGIWPRLQASDPSDIQSNITTTPKIKLLGHTGSIWAMGIIHEKDILVSGSSGVKNCLKTWDISTGKCLSTLLQHQSVSCVKAYSSKLAPFDFVTASRDSQICVWDMRQSKPVAEYTAKAAVTQMNGGRDDADFRIVTRTANRAVLWDLKYGGKRGSVKLDIGYVSGFDHERESVIANGQLCVSESDFRTKTKTVLHTAHTRRIDRLYCDRKWVVTASRDASVGVYDREKKRFVKRFIGNDNAWIRDVCVLEHKLIAVDALGSILYFDFSTEGVKDIPSALSYRRNCLVC